MATEDPAAREAKGMDGAALLLLVGAGAAGHRTDGRAKVVLEIEQFWSSDEQPVIVSLKVTALTTALALAGQTGLAIEFPVYPGVEFSDPRDESVSSFHRSTTGFAFSAVRYRPDCAEVLD